MKPLDMALRRWWEWKHGEKCTIPIEDVLKDFHRYRELERNGGGLTYKQFLYDKLSEIADEQYAQLEEFKKLLPVWKKQSENPVLDIDGTYVTGVRYGISICVEDVMKILNST